MFSCKRIAEAMDTAVDRVLGSISVVRPAPPAPPPDPLLYGIGPATSVLPETRRELANKDADLFERLTSRRIGALMPTAMADSLGYVDGYNPQLIAQGDLREIAKGVPRAGGDALCSCGYALRQHPAVQGALYLTRTCTGIVKL